MEKELTLMIKCKLYPDKEQKEWLHQTKLAYQQALNETSRYVFNQMNKKPSISILQENLYSSLRAKYNLGSQMTQSAFRQVKTTYDGLWTKWKDNEKHRKLGYTKNEYKGLDNPPEYKKTTMDLVYGKDYSLKKEQQVSILTLKGRMIMKYEGWDERLPLLKDCNWKIGTAKLWYCKRKKLFYLLIPVTTKIQIQPEGLTDMHGVDVGMRYLAVTDTGKKPVFFKSGALRNKKRAYQFLRSQLQKKGTRSAKRKLVQVSERERQFTSDVNHVISKTICQNGVLVGLEDLTNIRVKTNTYRKDKENRRQREQWAFADLHYKIEYKSILVGGLTLKVNPHHTSQDCPKCNHRSKDNRPDKGLLFICQSCGYTLHADLVAAKNIRKRTISKWQYHLETG